MARYSEQAPKIKLWTCLERSLCGDAAFPGV
jgi:hypothetical protein